MDNMRTYQDLEACGDDPKKRAAFILDAIRDHKNSPLYEKAVEAQLYYEGENPTITRYEKIIYDMQGRAYRDMYTANHKISSSFFGFAVKQEYNYLLGNGVSFGKSSTKKELGPDFDIKVSRAGEYALIGGESFGFWNLDHMDVFEVTEFVPLEDEENGGLRAGIRFWQLDPEKPLRCTLYELDGFTEYRMEKGQALEILTEKRPYILHTKATKMDSTVIIEGENYPGFPIIPLKNNRKCKSELNGKRNTIDALDLACSNMVNNVDEGNLIYWVLTNCGGMDDLDDARFVEQLKIAHVTHVDGEEGARAEAHTIEAPFQGTQATIDMLEKKLYQDFQAFDASAVTAGNQTATAIKASYAPLDLKVDEFERQVTEFILKILELAGIDDQPTYTRNKIINTQEEMQTLAIMEPWVDEVYMTKKALSIVGDGDMVEEIMKRRAAEDLGRFGENNKQQDN